MTGVRGDRFAWAEARVCSGVGNTGHEAGGEPVGCGHRPSYPIVNSSGQSMRISEAIGSLADLWGPGLRPPPKCFGHCCPMPHPHATPHRFPLPPAAVLASKGCVNTGDMSSGGQGDSSHPGQGMMGQASTCPPPPQSLWWEQGLGGASPLATTALISGSPGGGWSRYCPPWGSGPCPGEVAGPQTHLQERGL